MKNFVQLNGNIEMIHVLMNTLVEPLCAFENAYEYEDLDDIGMIRIYPENIPAANYQVFLTSLYYRLQDALYEGIQCNCNIPEPDQDSVFRVTASAKQANKIADVIRKKFGI